MKETIAQIKWITIRSYCNVINLKEERERERLLGQ